MRSFYDGMALVGSLVIMAAVIVLTYYASRWYARRMKKMASGGNIKVIDRLSLSPGASLFVVQVGDKFYLLGAGDKSIRLICELEGFTPGPGPGGESNAVFGRLLKGFMDKAANPEDDGTKT